MGMAPDIAELICRRAADRPGFPAYFEQSLLHFFIYNVWTV